MCRYNDEKREKDVKKRKKKRKERNLEGEEQSELPLVQGSDKKSLQ